MHKERMFVMAIVSSWIHGLAAVADPSRDFTVSATGKDFPGQMGDQPTFFVPIPTPVILHNGNRVKPLRVFVLFNAQDVEVTRVIVNDGPKNIYDNTLATPVSGQHDGTNGLADLQENVTQFTLPGSPAQVLFGLSISVRVRYTSNNGDINFTAFGAEFDG
jgi:hypothetical protein